MSTFIAIEGVIGVGKTTLARLLQQEFQAELLLEVFEENPFLADFYKDRARYALQTQLFFLLSRFSQQHNAVPAVLQRASLISDYMFAKDRLFAELNLSGDELDLYLRVHQIMAEQIRLPDLVVYLAADVDVLMQRITLRDRAYERGMDPEYIARLALAYERFFSTYTTTPVLRIDTNHINYLSNTEALRMTAGEIRTMLASGAFQQRLPLDTV